MAEEETPEVVEVEAEELPGLVGFIKSKFLDAETGRLSDERRWLSAYKNYRGITDTSSTYRSSEKSKVFVRITKVKVLAAFGQISDILFANNKFPITVSNTPVPEGIAEFAHLATPEEQMIMKQAGDVPLSQLDNFLGGLKEKYAKAPNLKEGPSVIPNSPQIEPAAIAARNMEKQIHDQLINTNATNVLRHAIFESALLGTGIIKGPFNYEKIVNNWQMVEGEKIFDPYTKLIPKVEAVSCWNFYPDPSATNIEDAEYIIQRHRYNREQLRDLSSRPFFDEEAIEMALEHGPQYEERYFENTIYSEDEDPLYSENRYEVFEYWGTLDLYLAHEIGLDLPDSVSNLDSVQINAWIVNDNIIRCVLNPFMPARIPYQAFPYELNPYQFFGVGVAENMDDAQLLMNGHMRMAIDNLALAGNMVFDIDETQLVPGQNMEVYPGKIFRRQSGVTGTAVNGLKFPNTAPENLQMYQAARQLADEETGIPSISHGQTGVTGTGRTAAGLSMIMGSAGLSIKTVVKNIDDFLLRPLGESFFQWNMQFNDDNAEIIGDLEIKPKGVASVMQKEVRTQRLITLLQTIANPMLAPFIKIPNLVRELAISQDIDPDQLVNNTDEAAIFADILRGLNESQNSAEATPFSKQPGPMGANGSVPVGANPMDPSGVGGGNIGVGVPPIAGEAGFTGNDQEPQERG